MKFCRYCDGMIEWGTEVCPHCGEILKVTAVDDLEFVTGPAAGAPPKPAPKPADDEEELETIEFEALELPPDTQEMPVLSPLSESPPVVMPLPAGRPPVVRPIRGRRGPPVVKPISPPRGPPVLKPISAAPTPAPVLTPIGGAPPAPTLVPVPDCQLCGEPMELRGGPCRHCREIVCVPCLMRANGMRAGQVMDMNRVRWSDRSRKMGPENILCPLCGKKGVDLV
jgi:hypothetical protein